MAEKFTVFNGKILDWAMKRADLSVADLGFPIDVLEKWLNSSDCPTVKEAEELAKVLGVPLPYFCLTELPRETETVFVDGRFQERRIEKTISLTLRKTVEHALECQEFMRDYMTKMDYEPFAFKDTLSPDMTSLEAVRAVIDVLGERKPTWNFNELFDEYVRRIERAGVVVQSFPVCDTGNNPVVDEFRGFALYDEYAPFIFINENDATDARLFTLLQLFCCILLGRSFIAEWDLGDKIEAFSADTAYRVWSDEEGFVEGSSWVMLRIFQFGRISKGHFWGELDKLRSSAKTWQPKTGKGYCSKRLLDAAVISAYDDLISFTDAMRLTGLSLRGLEQRAEKLRL